VQGAIARTIQHLLFALPSAQRLSATPAIPLLALLAPFLGGAILVLFSWVVKAQARKMVDAVEANALHGGRLSWSDSLVISVQTIISNGFGASVGMEAAYAQLGGLVSSIAGGWFRLRRADLRVLVGAGAGAAIAGAFYAFEIVIGAYTPAAIAPVAAASLSGVLVAHAFGAPPYIVDATVGEQVQTHHYLIYAGLGAIAAAIGILLMRAVADVEALSRRLPIRASFRPIIGGMLLVPLAWLTPQVLSAGHGALHIDLEYGVPLMILAAILVLKSAASIVSLAFGFRGGLFFASLFLGSLRPALCGWTGLACRASARRSHQCGLGGDGGAGRCGRRRPDDDGDAGAGSDTRFLACRRDHCRRAGIVDDRARDVLLFLLDLATPSPWRDHQERPRCRLGSHADRRTDDAEGRAGDARPDHRRRVSTAFPVRLDEPGRGDRRSGTLRRDRTDGRAFAEGVSTADAVGTLAIHREQVLEPDEGIKAVMTAFDTAGADEMAIVAGDGKVLGILSESYARRRYAEELDKSQREMFRED